MTTNDELILVTGGTGKTGRRVAQRLRTAGRTIRVASRNTEPPLDWDNRATWAPVLDGVLTAYLAYAPDVGFPGADNPRRVRPTRCDRRRAAAGVADRARRGRRGTQRAGRPGRGGCSRRPAGRVAGGVLRTELQRRLPPGGCV